MTLDDLKGIIETLQRRIGRHRDYLSENETRTRQMLIDPLLYALGWDVLDPDTVQLEYKVKQKRADYVLMWSGKPVAVIEAKRLGSSLEDNETTQVHIYANQNGIPYMIVTDGDKWEMYEVFKPVPLEERRLMKFELSQQLTHESMLRIWKPNLASGNPSEAMEPVVVLPQPGHDLPSSSPNEPQLSSNDPRKNSTLTLTKRLYLDYWTAFGEYLEQRNGVMKPRAPQPDQWIGVFTFEKTGGCALHPKIIKTAGWIRVSVYTPGKRGEAYFHLLKQDKTKIEAEIGNKLEWENKEENTTDRFISLYLYDVDLENRQDWDRQHQWLCDKLELFYEVFKPRIDALKKEKTSDA